MSNDPNRPGSYPPPQWDNQPQRGAYPAAAVPSQPPQNYRGPPPQGYPSNPSTPGDMVTLPPVPPHQGQPPPMGYPGPHDMHGAYGYGHPPPPHMAYPSQPAPRQRTAIACRYCRRRKIRCSGFENSEDGRCTNCQRFQQECIFTPVSSQAQAFVPAHTAYPHLRNQPGHMQAQRGGRPIYPQHGPAPLYGAHGQPLGPPMHDPNYPPPHPGAYGMPPQAYGPPYDQRGGAPPPPPEQGRAPDNSYPPPAGYPPHPYYGQPPPPQQQPPPGQGGPPPPQQPPPQQGQPPPQQQGQPARRSTPDAGNTPFYDARGSGSPHGSTSSVPSYQPYPPQGLHPPQALPPNTNESRTPPPGGKNGDANGNGNSRTSGMAVRDLLGPAGQSQDQGSRTNTDSNMLNALNKKM